MSFALSMVCEKCGREYPLDSYSFRCFDCNEPIMVLYDYEALKDSLSRDSLKSRVFNVWRYRELLPIKGDNVVSLFEGGTPLIKSFRIHRLFGFRNLYFKDESRNPTGSFKDRGSSVGVSKALEIGAKVVGCASTGNMASSLSAYATKAGLKCIILIPRNTPMEKIMQTLYYDPLTFSVDLPYPELYKLSFEAALNHGLYLVHSDSPMRIEGQKTIAYEICEQLNWIAPDVVIVPTSSGGNFSAIWKGFKEFYDLGFISKLPRMICVQSSGCAPIVEAFKSGGDLKPWVNPKTIAHSISNPNPSLASGNRVLRILRENNGYAEMVSDREISEFQRILAICEGLFIEPASAASVAVLHRLLDDGIIDRDETIVCILTGSGFKDLNAIRNYIKVPIMVGSKEEFIENITSIS
ncbi:MAG: threonine synthase [Candidatus Methanomethylicia archaeon]